MGTGGFEILEHGIYVQMYINTILLCTKMPRMLFFVDGIYVQMYINTILLCTKMPRMLFFVYEK